MLRVKRVYDPREPGDGLRFLVDRLWPRGMNKETLRLDGWLKELAPSDGLRHWFGHDPARWDEFCRRYHAELEENATSWCPLLETARTQVVTLLFAAHDLEHNNAVALRSFLETRMADREAQGTPAGADQQEAEEADSGKERDPSPERSNHGLG